MNTQTENTNDQAIVLSPEQEFAANAFEIWYDKFPETAKPFFVIEGFAGTGKSFSVNTIIERLNLRAKFMAYTGKAALVLNRYSGVDAATIHSTIYKLKIVPDDVFKELYERLDNLTDEGEKHEVELEINKLKQPEFELNREAFEEDRPDILVLDECSMVDEVILQDLCTFGIPIIALGDPGQLPPVKGEGALFKGVPNARLTEILRQALDSDIIKWSMWARQKRALPMSDSDNLFDPEVEVCRVPKSMLNDETVWRAWQEHDITICWRNKTRNELNMWVRNKLGFSEQDFHYPVVGETLIITKNDKKAGVFNGLFCKVTEVGKLHDNYIEYVVETELGEEKHLNLLRAVFDSYHNPDAMKALRPWDFKGTHQADFGYAITCHKSQGSQWPNVLVMDEDVFNWNKGDAQKKRAEWIYTAITRAVKKVSIVSGR